MIIPTIHLNGTSAKELIKQLEDAFHTLNVAKKALASASPHGRDYYPQGNEAIGQAVKEYRARMDKIIDVQNELIRLMDGIQYQIDSRR
jgi:hypothetical protein